MVSLVSVITQFKFLIASLAITTASLTQSPPVSNVVPTTTAGSDFSYSRNWSGYASTGGKYSNISGSWTVPQVKASTGITADATWIGIGGIINEDLIQSGTQSIITPSGRTMYTAFIETLPQVSEPIPIEIKDGDHVSVLINQMENDQWEINFKNDTTGKTYHTTVKYASSQSSAEWIEETPSTKRHLLNLTNFGKIDFTNGYTSRDGKQISIAESGARPITMYDQNDQEIAKPTTVNHDGSSFTVNRTNTASNDMTYFDHGKAIYFRGPGFLIEFY